MMVTIGAPDGDHFALPRGPHVHLAVDGRDDLRVALFNLGFLGQRTRVCCFGVARFVHGPRRDLRSATHERAPVADCASRRGQISLGRVHGGLGSLQAGDRFVPCLRRS